MMILSNGLENDHNGENVERNRKGKLHNCHGKQVRPKIISKQKNTRPPIMTHEGACKPKCTSLAMIVVLHVWSQNAEKYPAPSPALDRKTKVLHESRDDGHPAVTDEAAMSPGMRENNYQNGDVRSEGKN